MKRLELVFRNGAGKKVIMEPHYFAHDLSAEQVQTCMEAICEANIFADDYGVDMYVEPAEARLVETQTTKVYDASEVA
jgi:hypothetical protein